MGVNLGDIHETTKRLGREEPAPEPGPEPEPKPAEGAEPGPEPKPEPEPKPAEGEPTPEDDFVEIDGERIPRKDLSRIVKDYRNDESWKAENTRESERIARNQDHLDRQLQMLQDQQERMVREYEVRHPKEPPPPKRDPDEPVTFGEIDSIMAPIKAENEKLRKEISGREEARASTEFVQTIEDEVQGFMERSSHLKVNEGDLRPFFQMTMSTIMENEEALCRLPRRSLIRQVRQIAADQEKWLMGKSGQAAVNRADEKKDLARKTKAIPPGGQPAAPAPKPIRSYLDWRSRIRSITRDYTRG